MAKGFGDLEFGDLGFGRDLLQVWIYWENGFFFFADLTR